MKISSNLFSTNKKQTNMKNHFLKVKDFLLDLGLTITKEDSAEGLLIVNKEADGIKNLVVLITEPILIIEQHIFDKKISGEVAIELLKKNREIVHGAFVLDETASKLIFRDTLQIENLDLNELEGTINSLGMLLSEYSNQIIKFSKQ
jgi:hypothetical protein